MYIGYTRDEDSQNKLKEMGCDLVFYDEKDLPEGKCSERTQLLKTLQKGDVVVVEHLYVLSTTKKLARFVAEIGGTGADILSIGDHLNTASTEFSGFFKAAEILANAQKGVMSEATKAGLRRARARGRNGGRPRTNPDIVNLAFKLYDEGEMSISQICETVGLSNSALYRYLRERKEKV